MPQWGRSHAPSKVNLPEPQIQYDDEEMHAGNGTVSMSNGMSNGVSVTPPKKSSTSSFVQTSFKWGRSSKSTANAPADSNGHYIKPGSRRPS